VVLFMYTLAERYLELGESDVHRRVWLPDGFADSVRARTHELLRPLRDRRRRRIGPPETEAGEQAAEGGVSPTPESEQ
jgi:hypothetical protein